MKILFIGGTGRLSKDVAALALEKNNDVFLLTRGSKTRQLFIKPGYKMIYSDIHDAEKSKLTLQNYQFDVVIDFLTFNVEQLKNTLEVIENRYKQYVFISTATVYKKKNEEEVISEDRTEVGNDRWKYAWDKHECEKYLNKYFNDSKNIEYTVIRPYVTYGNTRVPYPVVPLDIQKEWTFMDRIKHNQGIPVFDQGLTITTLTHTRDFAKGVVGTFGNIKAYGEKFHITTQETVVWGQVIDELEMIMGAQICRVNVSQKEIYENLPEYKEVLLGDKGTNMQFDNSKIKNVVPDFSCGVSLLDGLKEMVKFYEEHQELQQIDYSWQGKMDRFCFRNGCKVKRKYKFANIDDQVSYYSERYLIVKLLKTFVKRYVKDS